MIEFWIDGQPPRKSNQRRLLRTPAGKPIIAKSTKATAWMEGALLQIPASAKQELGTRDRPVSLQFFVYYKNNQPDLSVELIMDCLQKGRVLSDDRYVFHTEAWKRFDKQHPGVYIIVEEMGPEWVAPRLRSIEPPER